MIRICEDTKALIAFIERNNTVPGGRLTDLINQEFSLSLTPEQVKSFIFNHHIRMERRHLMPREQTQWLLDNGRGRDNETLTRDFNERFGTAYTVTQITYRRYRIGAVSGIESGFKPGEQRGKAYWFKKGHESHNKGRKMEDFMTESQMEAFRASQFGKGHRPSNYLPVGSEVVRADGYMQVKVAEPRSWRLKHVLVWEEANGPVPAGRMITFLDGNRQNCSLENLALVTSSDCNYLNKRGRRGHGAEVTRAHLLVKRLSDRVAEMEDEDGTDGTDGT